MASTDSIGAQGAVDGGSAAGFRGEPAAAPLHTPAAAHWISQQTGPAAGARTPTEGTGSHPQIGSAKKIR